MIASFIDRKQDNWDKHLSLLTAAYCSKVHETTGFSPNFLLLGREVPTPIEVTLGIEQPSDDQDNHPYHKHAADLPVTMTEACRLARGNLIGAAARQKGNYDARL